MMNLENTGHNTKNKSHTLINSGDVFGQGTLRIQAWGNFPCELQLWRHPPIASTWSWAKVSSAPGLQIPTLTSGCTDPHFFTSDPIPIPEFGYLSILFRYQSSICFNIIIIIIVDFIWGCNKLLSTDNYDMYECMYVCQKKATWGKCKVRKTGNPVNRKNPILKTNMQL